MNSKLSKFISILALSAVSLFAHAGDFYIAISVGSSSIEDSVATQQYLPTPSTVVGDPVAPVTPFPPTLSFDDIFDIINQPQVAFVIPFSVESDGDEAGYEFSLGYHVLDNLDVEISYADLGDYSTTPVQLAPGGVVTGFAPGFDVVTPEFSIEQYAIRARYGYPIKDNLSLLASAGFINTTVDADFSLDSSTSPNLPDGQSLFSDFGRSTAGTGAQLGLGIGWQLQTNYSINLSYYRHFADAADLGSFLLSLEYDL